MICFPIFFIGIAHCQVVKENEMVVVNGEKFILHQVRTGETIYSISRDFKIESTQLFKNNPTVSDGLNVGQILKIPFNEGVDLSQLPKYDKGNPTSFIKYTVESNSETLYSISKKNGVTVEELYSYNPDVSRLKKGMNLKIPKWDLVEKKPAELALPIEPVMEINSQSGMIEHTVYSGETLYSLSKKYQVAESEIIKYNPDAMNLKAGSKIYLPAKAGEVAYSEKSECRGALRSVEEPVQPGRFRICRGAD